MSLLTKTSYCMSDDLSAGVRVRSSREERSVLGAESALCHGELEDGVGRVRSHSHMNLRPFTFSVVYLKRQTLYKILNFVFLLCFSFAPSLTVLCYKGDKERRAELQRETDTQDFNVLLTTYEVCGRFMKTK